MEDIDCNDLSILTATGAEGHNAKYTDELNNEWKEYAHNKIGSKHFNDTKWLATLDANTPIKVYNQGATFTSYSSFISFLNNIPRAKFPTKYTLDLSNVDASKITDNLNISSWSYSSSNFIGLRNYITYFFKLPRLTDMSNMFKSYIKLVESPKIPDSVKKMEYTFSGCTSLTSIPEIPSSVTSMNSTFNGCTSLKNFDVLDIKCKYTPNAFNSCNFESINNLVLTGGYMYSYNISSCNHVGVVTTNVLSYDVSVNTNDTSNSGYLYYYSYGSNIYWVFYNNPIKVDAVSTRLLGFLIRSSIPTSTGFNWWVDYIESDTVAVRQITQRTLNVTKHFDTLSASGKFKSDAFDLLIVNPDYVDEEKENHTFELVDFTIISSTTSNLNNNVNSITLTTDVTDPSKAIVEVDCKNIADNSISKGDVAVKVQYNALIDGYKFLGETTVTVKVEFDFQVVEEMELNTELIRDDDETVTE